MSTVFRVHKNANYTVMSNIHLKDRRLSYRAKGLLSVMLSLPPEWDYTLKGLAVIAVDGVDSVRSAVRELEKYGYLVRSRSRDARGRMSVNEYRVYENPADDPDYCPNSGKSVDVNSVENPSSSSVTENSPSLENPTTDEKSNKTQKFLEKSSLLQSSLEQPTLEIPTTDTYNILNTNLLSTHQSNHSIIRASRDDEDMMDFPKENISADVERKFYHALICERIDYPYFAANKDNPKLKINLAKVDELVSIMVDVVCSKKNTIRVNGSELTQKNVKQRYLELDSSHIEYVLDALEHTTGEIKNIRAYLITALYNAPTTIDSYYDALVKHDMRGGYFLFQSCNLA